MTQPLPNNAPDNPPEILIEISTRPGVTQRFAWVANPAATAAVILFAGGPGVIGLGEREGRATYVRDINFLVRSRSLFAERGLAVATIDAPSDRSGPDGMSGRFRTSPEHAADIAAIVSWIAAETGLPVWLVGTSRGTESAVYAALHAPAEVAGLVLTSTVSVTNGQGMSVLDFPLAELTLPVYIAAHAEDGCRVTPPSGATKIAAALSGAARVEVGMFSGDDAPISGPCDPLCQHGFLGIEQEVVERIAGFID